MGQRPAYTVNLAEARKLLINGINYLAGKKQNQIAAALNSAKMMISEQCAKTYILVHKWAEKTLSMAPNGQTAQHLRLSSVQPFARG